MADYEANWFAFLMWHLRLLLWNDDDIQTQWNWGSRASVCMCVCVCVTMSNRNHSWQWKLKWQPKNGIRKLRQQWFDIHSIRKYNRFDNRGHCCPNIAMSFVKFTYRLPWQPQFCTSGAKSTYYRESCDPLQKTWSTSCRKCLLKSPLTCWCALDEVERERRGGPKGEGPQRVSLHYHNLAWTGNGKIQKESNKERKKEEKEDKNIDKTQSIGGFYHANRTLLKWPSEEKLAKPLIPNNHIKGFSPSFTLSMVFSRWFDGLPKSADRPKHETMNNRSLSEKNPPMCVQCIQIYILSECQHSNSSHSSPWW